MRRAIPALALVCVLGLYGASHGETFCVRPNGTTYGSGDGSDWSNAFSGFPASTSGLWGEGTGKIGAGDTVYVAGGNYTTSLNPGAGGSGEGTRLVIRRATVAEHGPSDALHPRGGHGVGEGVERCRVELREPVVLDRIVVGDQ